MATNPNRDDERLLELLERWHSGDFSRADEQEMQALANSDEFRRDAVEGFLSSPEVEHQAHLASLQKRLRLRADKARRVSLPKIFMAAAATLLLALAVVWLLPTAKESAPIAQKEIQKSAENTAAAPSAPEEKSSEEPARDFAVARPTQPLSGGGSKPMPSVSRPAEGPEVSSVELASEKPPPPPSRYEPSSDKAVVAQPEAVGGAYGKVIDAQDDVDFAPGYAAPVKKDSEEESAAARAKQSAKAKKKSAEQPSASQPAGGWEKFQDYLRRNARLPEAARQQNVSGFVRLRFQLGDDSQPKDFKILQSLGYGCDEEAIRLVKAYSWQRGVEKELDVEVPFVR